MTHFDPGAALHTPQKINNIVAMAKAVRSRSTKKIRGFTKKEESRIPTIEIGYFKERAITPSPPDWSRFFVFYQQKSLYKYPEFVVNFLFDYPFRAKTVQGSMLLNSPFYQFLSTLP